MWEQWDGISFLAIEVDYFQSFLQNVYTDYFILGFLSAYVLVCNNPRTYVKEQLYVGINHLFMALSNYIENGRNLKILEGKGVRRVLFSKNIRSLW